MAKLGETRWYLAVADVRDARLREVVHIAQHGRQVARRQVLPAPLPIALTTGTSMP